jgi:predicted NBD/HSP70 family sugar kinase
MHLLGLDIADLRVVGVVADQQGFVVRRARSAGPRAAELAAELATGLTIAAVGAASETLPIDSSLLTVPDLPPARVCTAGTASVLAEAWVGAARGARHAICLEIGDRVFAGILLDGRPWTGAHGLAGSAAWLALNPVERQDYRKLGSLAAEVSSHGIARRLSWRIQAGDESAHVVDAARAADGVAISVVRDTAKYIGMALANLASCIDPEVVVLGGDIAAAGDLLFDSVRQEYGRRVPPAMAEQVRFAVSGLGDEATAIGAARFAALAGS